MTVGKMHHSILCLSDRLLSVRQLSGARLVGGGHDRPQLQLYAIQQGVDEGGGEYISQYGAPELLYFFTLRPTFTTHFLYRDYLTS